MRIFPLSVQNTWNNLSRLQKMGVGLVALAAIVAVGYVFKGRSSNNRKDLRPKGKLSETDKKSEAVGNKRLSNSRSKSLEENKSKSLIQKYENASDKSEFLTSLTLEQVLEIAKHDQGAVANIAIDDQTHQKVLALVINNGAENRQKQAIKKANLEDIWFAGLSLQGCHRVIVDRKNEITEKIITNVCFANVDTPHSKERMDQHMLFFRAQPTAYSKASEKTGNLEFAVEMIRQHASFVVETVDNEEKIQAEAKEHILFMSYFFDAYVKVLKEQKQIKSGLFKHIFKKDLPPEKRKLAIKLVAHLDAKVVELIAKNCRFVVAYIRVNDTTPQEKLVLVINYRKSNSLSLASAIKLFLLKPTSFVALKPNRYDYVLRKKQNNVTPEFIESVCFGENQPENLKERAELHVPFFEHHAETYMKLLKKKSIQNEGQLVAAMIASGLDFEEGNYDDVSDDAGDHILYFKHFEAAYGRAFKAQKKILAGLLTAIQTELQDDSESLNKFNVLFSKRESSPGGDSESRGDDV